MAGVVEKFGEVVGGLVPTKPDRAEKLLLTAFKLKRFQTRRLPSAELLPSGQLGTRLALEGVVDALERPQEAAITSIFLPTEPFLAMGVRPLIAEALSDYTSGACAEDAFVRAAEEAGVPPTYCSFHKVLLGYAAAGALPAMPMVANCSVACDANNTTFRWLAAKTGAAHVYVDVPYTYDEDACVYVADQLREMAAAAEDAYGRRLDEGALAAHVARGQETLAAQTATLDARRGHYLHNDMVTDMMQTLTLHLSLGSEQALAMARGMRDDFARAEVYKGLNIVWMHAMPYFSPSLAAALNQSQAAQIVACDMQFDQVSFDGWTHDASEPWLAMAERLIKNSFNGPATRRIGRVAELARRTNADGVVCLCHWGCKETMGASQLAKRELEAAGFPTLVLDGDCCHRANNMEGQMSTRMGAFLEMLRARREGGDPR